MSREIKFRAWHKREQRMYPAYVLMHDHVWLQHGETVTVALLEDVELMQFMGIQDKHGKDIYEGDIVRNKKGDTTVIAWEEDIDRDRFWATAYGFGIVFGYGDADVRQIEVIGNQYEHPHLLTQEEKP